MNFVLFLFSALGVFTNVLGLKVLGVFPFASKSHYTIGYSIVDALYEAGHDLTLLSPYPSNKIKENYREISLAELVEKMEADQSKIYQKFNLKDFKKLYFLENSPSPFTFGKLPIPLMLFSLFHFGALGVEMAMQHEGIQKLMKSDEKFDVCVIEIFNIDAVMVS